MQLSLLAAQDALAQLADSWLRLENATATRNNSNTFLKLADELDKNPNTELLVLCIHDGRPQEELHAVCILERHRGWTATKNALANWISEPGMDSTPITAAEQRFSALDTLLRALPSEDNCNNLHLRHLQPGNPTTVALQAVAAQRQLDVQSQGERRDTLLELKIPLRANTVEAFNPALAAENHISRSLP